HLPMGLHLPERALMGLRPEHIEPCSADQAIAFVDVRVVEALGADAFAYGSLAGNPVVVRLEPHASVKAGDKLPITASAEHLHWFDPQTTRRIEALA
ncbi:MAG: TOBE domain-containing protein, partial [Betaproteobacteria bacterium]|nr:TOBE domain-containing protein [Betaproteobacteria bacterium]